MRKPNRASEGLLLHVPRVMGAAPVNAVAASLTTALTGANNDLVFTAKTKGAAGNAITITYVDPEEETAAEVVEVTGTDIVVTLRSVSNVLSTAAQVAAAIAASAAASALVSVADKGADTGAGAVIAMAEDALEGGVDGTPPEVPWDTVWVTDTVYIHADNRENPGVTADKWHSVQLTLVSA